VIDAASFMELFKAKNPNEGFVDDVNSGMTVEGALRVLVLLPEGLDFSLEAPCRTWRECLSL